MFNDASRVISSGIGVDLVDIRRIEKAYNKYKERFLRFLLNDDEIELFYKRFSSDNRLAYSYLAKRWAGKEAIIKAFSGEVALKDFSILSEDKGAPFVVFKDDRKGLSCLISLTDEYPYAQAFCLVFKQK